MPQIQIRRYQALLDEGIRNDACTLNIVFRPWPYPVGTVLRLQITQDSLLRPLKDRCHNFSPAFLIIRHKCLSFSKPTEVIGHRPTKGTVRKPCRIGPQKIMARKYIPRRF